MAPAKTCCRSLLLYGLALFLFLQPLAPVAAEPRLGGIRGRVVDAATGGLVPYYRALAFARAGESAVGVGSSLEDGSFAIEGLEPGTYYVLIDGPEGRDLLVGGDEICLAHGAGFPNFATCDPTLGTTFEVNFDQVAEAGEIRLPADAKIRGTVTLAPGRRGQPSVYLYVAGTSYPPTRFRHYEALNATDYELSVPAGGTYFLLAIDFEHLPQVYDGLDCTRDSVIRCDRPEEGGTPVTVDAGEVRSGVDFNLSLNHQPCLPSSRYLCLGDGRFSVRAVYDTLHGFVDAAPAPISSEAGYFTFFDPGNVELVVKVLDACRDYDTVWVFATGLTDVGNIIEVRDNWAARTIAYSRYGPFRPFVDTETFHTCDATPPPDVAPVEPQAETRAAAIEPNGCGSDPITSLCLGDRFRVEAEWTTAGGETGSGHPQPLTADTGFFHFFSPANIEVVVKVLNACGGNLNSHYWLFAAGLTDVAVTLTVTDTRTGAEKIYLSPLGGLFQPILDLEAFATCP